MPFESDNWFGSDEEPSTVPDTAVLNYGNGLMPFKEQQNMHSFHPPGSELPNQPQEKLK